MTVGDLIKRLEKIDKDKMCIEDKGWANLELQEKYYYSCLPVHTKALPND